MIEKILRIKNVGKFVNYSCAGNMSFRRLTLIHAENGQGKTMLSAIFRSLFTGEGKYIKERCTLGQDEVPCVALRLSGSTAKFIDGVWNTTLPTMEIFDPTFVNENVYAGDTVDHKHKKNLHHFAIGEEGVRLTKLVAELDDDIRETNSSINSKREELEKEIAGVMDIDIFVNLKQLDNIDCRITSNEKEIEALLKADTIAKKPLLFTLTLPVLPFPEIENLLSKGLEDVSADAEQMVNEHILRCMDERGESWISQGIQYIKDDQCPFCGEDIQSVKLIMAYRTYFSVAYTNLKEEITGMSKSIERMLSQDKILSLQKNIEFNRSLSDFWKEYIEADFPDIQFDYIKSLWNNTHQLLAKHLERKATALLEKMVPIEEFHQVMTEYNNTRVAIEKCNQSIDEVNLKIMVKKEEVGAADLDTAQNKLQLLQITKKRFSKEVDQLCTDYQRLQQKKTVLEQEKAKARNNLQEYTSSVVGRYQEQINEYLKKFGAGFQIVETKERYLGGKPSLSYCISINEVAVNLEAPETSEAIPCFKNTLSSGDKSTLALAFFLAKLNQNQNLKEKVILFDDPISSLDLHRRTCTQQQIARFSNLAKQVILLSHDPYFLRLVWNGSDKSNIKTLCITRTGQGNVISEWDIERATQAEYYKDYFTLKEYLDEGSSEDLRAVARCIRPLIEENLRLRFPGQFKVNEWLGDMLRKIRESEERDPLSCLEPSLQELSEINEYSKHFHHDQNPDADSHSVSGTELRTYVERALNMISGVYK